MQPTLVMVPTTQQCQPQSKNFNTVFQQAVLEFAPSSRISSYLLVELSYQLVQELRREGWTETAFIVCKVNKSL